MTLKRILTNNRTNLKQTMKNAILAICTTALILTTTANAGVNGSYRVSGSETADGEKLKFTGTVTVSNYKAGTYSLKFEDGEKATYKFSFSKPLKETTASQTVNAFNNLGTSTATFYRQNGKTRVKFSYKSKDGSLRGSGLGSK